MKRIFSSITIWGLLAMTGSCAAETPFEEHAYHYTGGEYEDEAFRYQLLKPAEIEPGKTYPVVLFLHGAGERGDDNESQLKYFPALMAEPEHRQKYPCFIIAPQCRTGKRWVDVDWSAPESTRTENSSHQMKVALGVLHEALEKYPIDRRRVYLTGLSMGGYGSWDAAARHPRLFAAVAPICGGGDETRAEALRDVPIWTFHGDADQAVPVERSRKMIAAVKKAGGTPKYTEMPGVGHNSWDPAYQDPDGVIPWMFEQVNDRMETGGEAGAR